MHQSYLRPRRVQIAAVVCLIPTMLKDVANAIPESIKEFREDVRDEMNERKKLADMLYPKD